MMLKIKVSLAVVAFSLLAAPSVSFAEVQTTIKDTHHVERPTRFDVLGAVSRNSLGGPAWMVIPVLHDGFVPALNDSLDLELGGIAAWYSKSSQSYIFIEPAAGVKWNFHVLQELTVFVAAKAGVVIGLAEDEFKASGGGSVGVYWHLGQGVDLRFEAGYRYLAQLGVSFPL